MTTPGKLFVPAQDGTVQQSTTQLTNIDGSINDPAYGPAKDSSVNALHNAGQTIAQESQSIGVPATAPGIVGGEQILENPPGSPYIIYTFPSPGKVWAASVSLSASLTGGSGSEAVYARVYIVGGRTLAYCEVGLAGTIAYGCNGDSNGFPGFMVNQGTQIALDVNGGGGLTGGLVRAGGIFVGSIP